MRRALLLAVLAALVGVPQAAPSTHAITAGGARPGGTGWDADASDERGLNQQQFEFVCPAYGRDGTVWGTGTYTDDSSVCLAAVLEGKITQAGGGMVTIEIRPGQSSYKASKANGVTSNSYGAYGGSYVIVGASAATAGVGNGGSGWDAGTTSYSGFPGGRFVYGCPANGSAGSVWGTGTYTDDSSVCTAAVLDGKIALASGGTVTIEVKPGQSSYHGSTANGITSDSYGSYSGSFAIVSATRTVPAVSPGGTGWAATSGDAPGVTGNRYAFTCPAYGTPSSVWGNGTFTDDSSVCTAAVLEGRITLAGGGDVTVALQAGKSSYAGAKANGITSSSYASWPRSYTITAAAAATAAVADGGTGWTVNGSGVDSFLNSRFSFACPANGTPGSVWGTGTYTSDSSVCTAAVHAGLISVARGGTVTAEMRPGQSSYKGSTAHGITSNSYGSWSGSFVLTGASAGGAGSSTGGGGSGAPPNLSTPPPAPPKSLSPPLPTPVGGSSVDVKTFKGTVLVNGKPLAAGQQIRVGSTVDAGKGTITMTSASPTGGLQTANFASGKFKVGQKGKTGNTALTMTGGDFGVCKRKTAAAKPNQTVVRGLWGNGKGQFETKGRYAAATVRGTIWLVEDRCDGTLIIVKKGTVTVVDSVHHRTVTVTAGHQYLA
jgi:hypothetical protein